MGLDRIEFVLKKKMKDLLKDLLNRSVAELHLVVINYHTSESWKLGK